MLIAGIDPGLVGAAALVDVDALRVVSVIDLPIVRAGKTAWLDGAIFSDWLDEQTPDYAIVEGVWYRAGDPNPTNTGAMLRIAGGCEAVLSAMNVQIAPHPQPAHWLRRAGIPSGLSRPERLTRVLALAKARLSWPHGTLYLANHHDRAAAALIALFGRAPVKAPRPPKRSKLVDRLAAENVPPGGLFGTALA